MPVVNSTRGWAKIMKDGEKPLKSAVARCLDWWHMQFGGEFPVYITKFSGWKKFAKDIGKEQMRELFGMSQSHGLSETLGTRGLAWLGVPFWIDVVNPMP